MSYLVSIFILHPSVGHFSLPKGHACLPFRLAFVELFVLQIGKDTGFEIESLPGGWRSVVTTHTPTS